MIYPGKELDHHFFYFTSNASRSDWPRHFKGIEKNKLEQYLKNYFSQLERDFSQGHEVILSTEYIFFSNKYWVENIFQYLRKHFTEINIYCFLREPVDFYKSMQQQYIKGQSYIDSPEFFKYDFKEVIQIWESLADEMTVLKFDKQENSFVSLCNNMGFDSSGFKNLDHRTKGSVSIEQMILMEKVYKNVYQKLDDRLSGKLHVKTIAQINSDITNKPKLKKGVGHIIYKNHQDDINWLKENHGIDFTNNSYEEANTSATLPSYERGKASIREVFQVPDEELVEKYEAQVVDLLLKKLVLRV